MYWAIFFFIQHVFELSSGSHGSYWLSSYLRQVDNKVAVLTCA
jgi:hypothetical protein